MVAFMVLSQALAATFDARAFAAADRYFGFRYAG